MRDESTPLHGHQISGIRNACPHPFRECPIRHSRVGTLGAGPRLGPSACECLAAAPRGAIRGARTPRTPRARRARGPRSRCALSGSGAARVRNLDASPSPGGDLRRPETSTVGRYVGNVHCRGPTFPFERAFTTGSPGAPSAAQVPPRTPSLREKLERTYFPDTKMALAGPPHAHLCTQCVLLVARFFSANTNFGRAH
jgi:hypothetical protein